MAGRNRLREGLLLGIVVADLFHVGRDDQVVGSVRVDLDLAELASADVVLKQDIEVSEGKTLAQC
jgi:hypothetical protein